MTRLRFEDVAVGDSIPELSIAVDRARLIAYAGASGDRNPIHWDERAARAVGLPDVIAHGMFTMGAVVEAVSAWAGHGAAITGYATKFVASVPVPYEGGAELRVTGKVTKLDEAARAVTVELGVTSAGAKVLGRPLVTVALA